MQPEISVPNKQKQSVPGPFFGFGAEDDSNSTSRMSRKKAQPIRKKKKKAVSKKEKDVQ